MRIALCILYYYWTLLSHEKLIKRLNEQYVSKANLVSFGVLILQIKEGYNQLVSLIPEGLIIFDQNMEISQTNKELFSILKLSKFYDDSSIKKALKKFEMKQFEEIQQPSFKQNYPAKSDSHSTISLQDENFQTLWHFLENFQ